MTGPRRLRAGVRAPLWACLRLWWRERRGPRLSDDKVLGFFGEDAAARFLRRAGFRVAARNVLAPMGEADLVCQAPDGRTMVVVEVKTRRVGPGDPWNTPYPPELSVDARKRDKLAALARHLARLNRWRSVRIDVVAVAWPPEGPPAVRHWIDAVR